MPTPSDPVTREGPDVLAALPRRGHVRDASGRLIRVPVAERFWPKVDRRGPEECWPWIGYLYPAGYGFIEIDYRMVPAHRVSYELLIGPIPDGLEIDHLCRNRACVNPAHLEPVTHRVNVLRGTGPSALRANVTECLRGHEYTPANTVMAQGKRSCRACRHLASARRWQATLAARGA